MLEIKNLKEMLYSQTLVYARTFVKQNYFQIVY